MNRWAVFFSMVAVLILFLSACGKKGPPVPPSSPVPPEVAALEMNLEGNLMTLSWRVATQEGKADTVPDGFFVYRSRIDPSNACVDCPHRFEKAADIPGRNDQTRTTYTELLEKGFQYEYKVSSYMDIGKEGPVSAAVSVDFSGTEEN